ncbi:MAG: ABC transporter substrate-binding protein [Chloroflexi bacterium]|nr:ABC transporter substrate-binding protein [Chloroflexota bacterium]
MNRFLAPLLLFVFAACTPAPSVAPAAPAVPTSPSAGWPRQIESAEGPVSLAQQPNRVHALSLGFEEILLALIGPERFAAVSTFAVDPSLSNVVPLASRVSRTISRDPEAILASDPDVIIASTTTRRDLIDRLRAVGVPVVIAPFRESIDVMPQAIRWLARIVGEEAAGERMVRTVEERLARIDTLVASRPEASRPRALLVTGKGYYVAGKGTLREALLLRAGGRNAAAEAGIEGDKTIGLEAIVAINPPLLLTADTLPDAPLARELREQPALAEVAAIRQGRVVAIRNTYLSVLSHYQVRGVEELAKALYPSELAGVTFPDFPERF